jgi:hypothetical protein
MGSGSGLGGRGVPYGLAFQRVVGVLPVQESSRVPAEVSVAPCRPGERAGLLQAEVVDLQSGHLAVPPAADDRVGDLVGVDPELSPTVLGPGT